MPSWSVRTRVTVLGTVAVALALAAGAALLITTMRHELATSNDELARSRAADLSALATDGSLPSVLVRAREESLEQVVDEEGRVLAASANLPGAEPVSPRRLAPGEIEVLDLTAPDDDETEQYRVWALGAESPEGPVTVFVGTSLESVEEATAAVRRSLLVGLPVLILLLGVAIWVLVGRALQPIESIRREVDTITASEPGRRVPEPATDDEVSRLARTMNSMLDRLAASAEQQREFVGNASHELQSPIAALRTQLEVALAHPEGVVWPELASDLLQDTGRMERLARDLLFLARVDEATPPGQATPVSLREVVREQAALLTSGEVVVDLVGVEDLTVQGRVADLGRLVRNLLENAARHASGRVTVTAHREGDAVVLEVRDDGPGIPDGEHERIFERFHRIDVGRARETGGAGLGLSIARAIAGQHGGTLVASDAQPGPGAVFVVRLPGA